MAEVQGILEYKIIIYTKLIISTLQGLCMRITILGIQRSTIYHVVSFLVRIVLCFHPLIESWSLFSFKTYNLVRILLFLLLKFIGNDVTTWSCD